MSDSLQSIVTSLIYNNYVTLVICTSIGYDYILTFSYEVEYVWKQSWSWVPILFVLIRYVGLCGVMIYTFMGSSFLPGPSQMYVFNFHLSARLCSKCFYHIGTVLTLVGTWAMLIFIAAADLVMILRVFALYSQSRIILGVLLALYAAEIIPYIIAGIMSSIPDNTQVTVAEVLDFKFCAVQAGSPVWAVANDSIEFALAAVMFLLAVGRFIKDSIQVYRAMKRWQPGRYLTLLAREGTLYFLAILLFNLVNVMVLAGHVSTTGWRALLIGTVEYVPVFTLTPRFIMNVRALYARDSRRNCPRDMDSEFGFTPAPGRGGVSTIEFADAEEPEGEELEPVEEFPMGEQGTKDAENGCDSMEHL